METSSLCIVPFFRPRHNKFATMLRASTRSKQLEMPVKLFSERETLPYTMRYKVRLKRGVAISSVPMPKANRNKTSVWMAAKPPSFKRIALKPCTA